MSTAAGSGWVALADEPATLAFARRMAECLPEADAPMVVYLQGTLGAGKTTLTRGLLQALGEPGPVRSPTYGLVSEYTTPAGAVLHLDLYRLQHPEELQALGLADYLAGSRLWLIEWPDRGAGQGLPPPDLEVQLEPDGVARRLRVIPHTRQGSHWLARLSAEAGS